MCNLIRFCFLFYFRFFCFPNYSPYSHREKCVPLLENPYGSPSMYLKFCGVSEATPQRGDVREGDVRELWWSVYWLGYLSNLRNGCNCSCSLLSTRPVNALNHSCFRERLTLCVDETYNDISIEVFCQSQEILYLSIKINHEKKKKMKMKAKKIFFRETHKVSKEVVNMRTVSPGNQIN